MSEPATPRLKTNERYKRVFDLVICILLFVLLLPFILISLVGIKVEQILRGNVLAPLLYHEIRYTKGQPFQLYKFNIFKTNTIKTMRANGSFIHTKQLEKLVV